MKIPPRQRPALASKEARAEHALLQGQSLQLGQAALRQHGIPYTQTVELPTGNHLAAVPSARGNDQPIRLEVTVVVEVNPTTSAAIRIHTT